MPALGILKRWKVIFSGCILTAVLASTVYAETGHRDLAPLPDDVVQVLLKNKFQPQIQPLPPSRSIWTKQWSW